MSNILLRIIDILFFSCFAYAGLRLIERIAGKKRYSALLFAAISLVSAIVESALVPMPIWLVYIISCCLLYIYIFVLFRISGINNIYGTLAILVSAMALRGMVAAVVSLTTDVSIYQIFSDDRLTIITNIGADLICFLFVVICSKIIPAKAILLSVKPRAEKSFLMGWVIISAILLVLNAIIFEFSAEGPAFSILEFTYCLALQLGCYAMLFFTFRFNAERAAANSLTSELLAQDKLQSALIQNALFVAKANLTQNKIIDGLAVYSETFSQDIKYDDWLAFTQLKVHPDDFTYFYSVLNRDNLFDCFERGTEPDPFSYRRLGTDDEYHWVKVSIRLYNDTTTGDIHIVGYALDVDKDMKEKAELQRRAQTDSLTKLLNRDAAEKAISQEISKGCGALFIMDIDDFKDVNDCMGHETGDKVLIGAARRLQEFFGEDNIVGRLGGDEFLAYLKNVNNLASIHEHAEKLLSFMSLPPDAPDEPTITFSIGVVPVIGSELGFKEVYSLADSALYEVKYNGKHGYKVNTDLAAPFPKRTSTPTAMESPS